MDMHIINYTFILLIVYQFKHFIADFPLQGKFMLGKFKPGWDFLLPLLAHCSVHALATLGIVWFINPALWWLSLVDFSAHFVMDRVKAGPKYLGRFKALTGTEVKKSLDAYEHSDDPAVRKTHRDKLKGNVLFWWSLGLDQKVHHLTHYFIIYMLVADKFSLTL